MKRRILTLLLAAACPLVFAGVAQAATWTANPTKLGAVVVGHHPRVKVTFRATPGLAFQRSTIHVNQTRPTVWELVADPTCTGPLSQPDFVTSCTAILRVFDPPIGTRFGSAVALQFKAVESDPSGGTVTTRNVNLNARVYGHIVAPH